MSLGIAIDPGMSTGICLFDFHRGAPFRQLALWQVSGGAVGLTRWLEKNACQIDAYPTISGEVLDVVVVEKFTPRGGAGFSLTEASVEPLRCEGVLIGRGFGQYISWQPPATQYFMGGVDLREKKKRSREFLKLHGIYATGKMVGQADADDAISAELHAIAYLRRARHMPTLEELFQEEED